MTAVTLSETDFENIFKVPDLRSLCSDFSEYGEGKMKNESKSVDRSSKCSGVGFCLWVVLVLQAVVFSGCACPSYSGMVSWTEYNSMPRENPYVLELDFPKGSLFYYGVFHSTDKGNRQFREIEKKWKEFSPDVVFSEGGIWPLENSMELSITRHGEQGLLRYLSRRDGVRVKSIEPKRIKEAIYLAKYFSVQKIKVFYILRQAVIQRMLNKPMNGSHVRKILGYFDQRPFCNIEPVSVEQFNKFMAGLFPELPEWKDIPETWFYSQPSHPWLPRMFRMVNDFRNRFMVKKMIKEIKKGKRVFAVVGRSHVVMQEPVLRSMVRK